MTGRIERRGDVIIVWNTNNAKRGALSEEYYAALREGCVAGAEPGVAAVVLASEGEFFCAGGDLTVLVGRRNQSEAARREAIEELHDCVRAIRDCPAPVIAAVEGGAAGAGVSLALACDMLVAARGSTFTMAYVRAGLVPDGGLTQSLASLMPAQLMVRLLLLGESIEAERLEALGALSALVAPGEVLATALALAARLNDGARDTQRAIKLLLHSGRGATLDQQLDREAEAMTRAQGSDESAEGIDAFLEKRAPDFRGLRK